MTASSSAMDMRAQRQRQVAPLHAIAAPDRSDGVEVLWEENPRWRWGVVLLIVLVLRALMRFVEL
jgi:hypothetical protein